MPSEYDFLLPYSRRARRAGRAALIAGVFGLGVACTALVIALPMRPAERQATNATDSRGKEATAKPVAAPSRPNWDWARHSPPQPKSEAIATNNEPNSATESTATAPAGPAKYVR